MRKEKSSSTHCSTPPPLGDRISSTRFKNSTGPRIHHGSFSSPSHFASYGESRPTPHNRRSPPLRRASDRSGSTRVKQKSHESNPGRASFSSPSHSASSGESSPRRQRHSTPPPLRRFSYQSGSARVNKKSHRSTRVRASLTSPSNSVYSGESRSYRSSPPHLRRASDRSGSTRVKKRSKILTGSCVGSSPNRKSRTGLNKDVGSRKEGPAEPEPLIGPLPAPRPKLGPHPKLGPSQPVNLPQSFWNGQSKAAAQNKQENSRKTKWETDGPQSADDKFAWERSSSSFPSAAPPATTTAPRQKSPTLIPPITQRQLQQWGCPSKFESSKGKGKGHRRD